MLILIRTFSSVALTILLNALHFVCCLLPFFTSGAAAVGSLYGFARYQSAIMGIQFVVLAFVLAKLAGHYLRRATVHGKVEVISYHISVIVLVAGFFIGRHDLFKTDFQQTAERQFAFFKSHRQMTLGVSGKFDSRKFITDVAVICGVKSSRVHGGKLLLTFESNKVSSGEILEILKAKGYFVTEKNSF